MKRFYLVLLTLLVAGLLLLAGCAYADPGGTDGNITWTLSTEGVLTISGNAEMNTGDSKNPWLQYKDKIYSVVIEDGITSLSESAFELCEDLESVTIPESVNEIGKRCFWSCESLQEISIPNGVKTIPVDCFRFCISLQNVIIPNTVTTIGEYAFDNCKSLITISIPDSVTSIDWGAFYGCEKLESIRLSKNITNISGCMLRECSNLAEISIPKGVQSIDSQAFAGCNSLQSVIIPDGVKVIDELVFYYCPNLHNIVIPASVTKIGDRAFDPKWGPYDVTFLQDKDTIVKILNTAFTKTPSSLTIYCFEQSSAENFAIEHEINYVHLDRITSTGHSLFKTSKVEATRTEPGTEEYWTCSACKKMFSDSDATVEIKEPVTIPVITPQGLIQAFVKRCYKLILNRDADEGGLQGWSDALINKTAAAANIIDSFVKSDEFVARNVSAGDSVDILYSTMLGRKADEGGKAGWVDALGQGFTLQHIINGFCASDEFTALCKEYGIEPGIVNVNPVNPQDDEEVPNTPRGKIEAFVKRCYKLILSRDADEGGLKGWSDALETRTAAAAQIIDGFVRSEEYINRNLSAGESVDILYKTMLDREADAGGRAGWVDALGQGFTLQHIINGFCGSQEFTAICDNYGIVAGSVSVQGALAKREAIAPEGEEEAAAVVVVQSEYTNEEKIRAFVEHCYEAVFGRQGDAEGVENYTKAILDGKKTPKKVAYEFIFSPEFQNQLPGNEEFIRILYRLYFDREPGEEELNGWIQMLEGGASLEEIVNGFAGSAEFKAIINSMKD